MLLSRFETIDRKIRQLMTRRSYVTIIACLLVASLLQLFGALLLCIMAMAAYQMLNSGRLNTFSPSTSGNLPAVLWSWVFTLAIAFGGNLARSWAFDGLRCRRFAARTGTAAVSAPDTAPAGLITACMSLLVGPIMVFWGVLCAWGSWNWLSANLPPAGIGLRWWTIPYQVGSQNFEIYACGGSSL